ncbi:ATP-dependent Clp protease proteolytic subunit-related protein 4, chloroplastic-like [Humulus lupulus]|uniref:ATP-dependent Clp protease proteolytic subunit-related protein 4, chloroplastic-like n=1 Tax=Humulus lupulus TaxID=3486 RepID=UPI002B4124B1|nr:ATP-dependent Clp protease proteolytic subunit-related protein 4, chloroplastic-like [Humulus lupulus]
MIFTRRCVCSLDYATAKCNFNICFVLTSLTLSDSSYLNLLRVGAVLLRFPFCSQSSLASDLPKLYLYIMQVIPFSRGSAWEQPPPDLASYLYKNRIVYLGMSLVPSVTKLILVEFLYLQYEDANKPISLYINSTGKTKGGEKLGYETEVFAIYDVMGCLIIMVLFVDHVSSELILILLYFRYVKPPIFTLCW